MCNSWNLGSLNETLVCVSTRMISEFLIGKLGEYSLFSEVYYHFSLGLGDSIRNAW